MATLILIVVALTVVALVVGIETPDILGLFKESQETWKAREDLNKKVEDEMREFRRRLQTESGLEALHQRWREQHDAAQSQAEAAVHTFAQKVWQGEAGKGQLVVIQYDGYSYPGKKEAGVKVGRVVVLNEDNQELKEWLQKEPWLELKSGEWRRFEILSALRPYSVTEFLWKPPQLGEVDPGVIGRDELDALFLLVRERPVGVGTWAELGMWPSVLRHEKPGKHFFSGGSSHHSGEIDGYWLFLPSRRWAHCVDYDGDNDEAGFCTHVVQDPLPVGLEYSAKYGGSVEVRVAPDNQVTPTKEEMEFLKLAGYLYRPPMMGESGPALPLGEKEKEFLRQVGCPEGLLGDQTSESDSGVAGALLRTEEGEETD